MRVVKWRRAVTCACALGLTFWAGCGKEQAPQEVVYDVNLLKNGSFEEVGEDGLPVGWSLSVFRGLETDVTVRYLVDDRTAQHGERSWRFDADPTTRRFLVLEQDVEVPPTDRVRLEGWMQLDRVDHKKDQFAHCNFLLTFYDEDHRRFQELRFADKRTKYKIGTSVWEKVDKEFRVPDGTRYVAVQCILGMSGTVWFDDISLSIPRPIDWRTATTTNFVFHWLPGHPPPQGAIQMQQELFNTFEARLGLDSKVVIDYYYYPDTTTIQEKLSLKGHQYVSWDDFEFHSINANDNHEIIHFMTDPIGRPPRSVAEGTVLWLHNEWMGHPIHVAAATHLLSGNLTPLEDLLNYKSFVRTDGNYSLPSIASFVGYLAETWGPKKLMDLYAATHGVNEYEMFSAAFEKTYDVPIEVVEEEWRSWLRSVDISDVPRAGG